MSKNNKNKKKEEQYRTLLSVLANGSWDSARELLKKHSGQDATDTKDLEVKLARVYALSPRKYEIEKEFADIHPHKDFILKYNQPKLLNEAKTAIENLPMEGEPIVKIDVPNEVVVSKQVIHESVSNAQGHAPCGNPNCPKCSRYFANSSCEGSSNCSCNNKISSACGCSSSFSGYSNVDGQPVARVEKDNTQGLMIVGIVSIVAVVGMVLYLKSKK